VVSGGRKTDRLSGAQFLFYPTAIGWLPDESSEMNLAQHSAWETIQRAHAIANGVYVVVVNRVGHEGNLLFGANRLSLIRWPHHREGFR
jgi:N-carbamoylputrescine amidase